MWSGFQNVLIFVKNNCYYLPSLFAIRNCVNWSIVGLYSVQNLSSKLKHPFFFYIVSIKTTYRLSVGLVFPKTFIIKYTAFTFT